MASSSTEEIVRAALRDNPDLAAENANNAALHEWVRGNRQSRSKYNNTPTTIDGIRFDSKREAEEYCVLKLLERAGDITDLVLQPRFVILDAVDDPVSGIQQRKIEYVADFQYRDRFGRIVVVDTKGDRTDVYKNKLKMFRARYPDLLFEERK